MCSWYEYIIITCDRTNWNLVEDMVDILIGNWKVVAHVWSDLSYLICLRHWFKSRFSHQKDFAVEKTYFYLCVHNMFLVTIQYNYHGWRWYFYTRMTSIPQFPQLLNCFGVLELYLCHIFKKIVSISLIFSR